ncbi:hypothetical protein ANAPC3_01317 [Anaplasma phagocytophilum]|nr:hypothetical protein ANAPC2_01146 [Anaplasma phagocytophilum]SBO33678.1 hypothetical protein ANAPC3_01317 [Anaplasma phagocytophilum]SBO33857.1 hypothetical protein ANAPC4_01323 [Anaplasma phagocytophilum]
MHGICAAEAHYSNLISETFGAITRHLLYSRVSYLRYHSDMREVTYCSR